MEFQKLKAYIDSLPFEVSPGCEIIIAQDHRELFHYTHGFSDYERTVPVTEENLYFLYSATKLFTCTAAAQLLERGQLSLEDRVSKYLPEFSELYVKEGETLRPAKTPLTVKQLFTMTGGLTYNLGDGHILELCRETSSQATTRQMMGAIAKMPLIFDPGASFNYSLCHDVLAGIVEVISGLPYSEYLKKNIFEPLGIREMTFHVTDKLLPRISAQYAYDPEQQKPVPTELSCPYKLSEKYESGGAGLVGGARDYILLADALACGGLGKSGNRILKPETVDLMRQNHLNEAQFNSFCKPNSGYSYGLGVRTKIKQQENNAYSPLGEFGWDGAAGAFILIDPENKLSLFYVQHVRGNSPMHQTGHSILRDLTYQDLGKEKIYEKN